MSKDQQSSPDAQDNTSTSATNSKTERFTAVCVWQENLLLISPEASKRDLSEPLIHHNMQHPVFATPAKTYWTHCWIAERRWMTDSSDTKLQLLKVGCLLCVCIDTLNGMCIHCLWASERLFCSRLFKDNLHSRKVEPLYFVLIVFSREKSLSHGLLLKWIHILIYLRTSNLTY